jgi:uncharacterized surface protein with fasciclin (FAS1) repeats
MKTLTPSVVAGGVLLALANASFAMNEMYIPGMDSRRSGDPMHLMQAARSSIVNEMYHPGMDSRHSSDAMHLMHAKRSTILNEMYNPGMDSRRSGDPMHLIQAKKSTIVDTAISAGQFNTLVKAVQEAGLVDTLRGKGPFTVFAPTDEAFAKLPAGTLEALLQDKEKLAAVLTYHVVPKRVMAAQVKPGKVKTVQGQSLNFTTMGGAVMVDNAKVIKTDVLASNGVIHVIDTVVLPN